MSLQYSRDKIHTNFETFMKIKSSQLNVLQELLEAPCQLCEI